MRLAICPSAAILCTVANLAMLSAAAAESPQESGPASQSVEPAGRPDGATDDAPPVHIDDVLIALDSTDQAIESLQATYHCESLFNIGKPGTEPKQKGLIEDDAVAMTRSADVTWEANRDGLGRMEATFVKTNTRFDGSKVVKHQEWISAFDGRTCTILDRQKAADGSVLSQIGRITPNFMRTHSSPFDFATQHLGVPICELLVEHQAEVRQMGQWEDRPVVIVEALPVTVRDDYIYQQRFWIDMDRKAVVRRQSFVQRGEGMPWALHLQIDAKKHDEVAPDIWLPKEVESWNYHVSTEGQDFLVSHEQFVINKWMLNEELDSSRFVVEFPEGTITAKSGPRASTDDR